MEKFREKYWKESNDNYGKLFLNEEPSKDLPQKDSKYTVKKQNVIRMQQMRLWKLEFSRKKLNKNRTIYRVYFATRYKESILNGANPVLTEGLVSVKVKEK